MHFHRSMMTTRCLLAVALAAGLGACQPTASAKPTPSAKPDVPELPPSQRFEHDVMVRFHMHASFDTVRSIERLLIRGKLDDARFFARSLSVEPDLPGMSPWAQQITLVRQRAAAVAEAPGIDEAGRREAKLAQACASCHADAGAQPEFRPPPPAPADQPTVAARMARHVWATDRLWEGMVGDVDEPWAAGLDVIAATPLPWPDLGADRAGLARQLQQLANQARHAAPKDLDERARSYGEILVTCAACHATPTK